MSVPFKGIAERTSQISSFLGESNPGVDNDLMDSGEVHPSGMKLSSPSLTEKMVTFLWWMKPYPKIKTYSPELTWLQQ